VLEIRRATRAALGQALVGLAVLTASITACGAAAPSRAQETAPAGGPRSSSPALASASPNLDSDGLAARLLDGKKTASALVTTLSEAFDSGDIEAVRAATTAITEWTSAESASLNADKPDACLRVVQDAYGLGLKDMSLGAISISIGLIEPTDTSPKEMEQAATQVANGLGQVEHAVDLWSSTDCSGVTPSGSSPSLPDDPAAAYATVADDINERFGDLADIRSDSVAYASGLLELEEEMATKLAVFDVPAAASADVDGLRQAIAGMTGILRLAAAGTPKDAESNLRVALLGALPEQVAAVDALRAALGLPDAGESELF
jgi:hypothetical protein